MKKFSLLALWVGILIGLTQVFAATNETRIRVTIAPEPVLCTWVAPQECLVMTVDGEQESTLLYENISGFDFKKWNTYELELKKTKHDSGTIPADRSSISYELVREISRSFDPKVCSAESYFDGCNTCTRWTWDYTACTLMYCELNDVPSCKYDEPLIADERDTESSDNPTFCTLEYNPQMGLDGVMYWNPCMADAAGVEYVNKDDKKAALYRAYGNKLTIYDDMKDFMPDNHVTREQAAKMFVEFTELYAPRPEDRKLCVFSDESVMTADLKSFVYKSCNLRLFKGYDDGSFWVRRDISQPEFITVLERISKEEDKDLIEQVVKNKALLPHVSRINFINWLYEFYNLSQ